MDAIIINLIEDWLKYLQDVMGYSVNTVNSYRFDIENFLYYVQKNNNGCYSYDDFVNIDQSEIRGWFAARKNANISHRSNLRAFSSLKNLIKYLNKYRGFVNEKIFAINLKSQNDNLPNPISIEDILMIVNNVDNKIFWIKKRNQTLIFLLYATGVRISEALNLKIGDISNSGSIKVLGKGGKERQIPLISGIFSMLKDYIAIIPFTISEQSYIFCSTRGNMLSRISVAKYLIDIRKKLSLAKSVTAHAFRHSFATHLINKDVDLRNIQKLLGHSNITTTEIYTKLDTSSLIKSYKKFHPRNE